MARWSTLIPAKVRAAQVMKASQTYATNPLIHFDGDAKPMPDGLEPKTRRPRIRCVRMGVAMRMVAKGGARPSGLEQEHPAEARAVTRMVLQNGVESAGECDASQDGDGVSVPAGTAFGGPELAARSGWSSRHRIGVRCRCHLIGDVS